MAPLTTASILSTPVTPTEQHSENEPHNPIPATPASATAGFIQSPPVVRSAIRSDIVLHRVIDLFLASSSASPAHESSKAFHSHLSYVSDLALSRTVLQHVTAAGKQPPYLLGSGRTSLGAPQPSTAALVTSHGWRALQELTIGEVQVVRSGWPQITTCLPERENAMPDFSSGLTEYPTDGLSSNHLARIRQMLLIHSWAPSSAYTVCPSAMQDGAVAVISSELHRLSTLPAPAQMGDDYMVRQACHVFARALQRLLSPDPKIAWTSGQWMTERPGGSDVSGTETVATLIGSVDETAETDIDGQPLGPWRIDGFKWFSSAADGGCTILLARTTNGISCFFAPTRKLVNCGSKDLPRLEEAYNGISPQRLKTKLGTHALPTAELELKGMRAWLIGHDGQGVKIISAMLNITRVYTAASAVAPLGRALGVVRAYSHVRELASRKGVTLQSVPLYARTVSKIALAYRADMLLTFFVAALLGRAENPTCVQVHPNTQERLTQSTFPQTYNEVALLLRILTPLAKARTAKTSISGLQECMECLGGLGYLENDDSPELNIAILYRDTNVLSIWEGTTDIMATDIIKVLKGRSGEKVLGTVSKWIKGATATTARTDEQVLDNEVQEIENAWDALVSLIRSRRLDDLLVEGREVLQSLGNVVCATLLVVDARRDSNDLATIACQRFVAEILSMTKERELRRFRAWDRRLAFEEPSPDERATSKL